MNVYAREGLVQRVHRLEADLARERERTTALRDALDDVKGNVYLYRIEHLTPDTLVQGIEESLVKAYSALAASSSAEPARCGTCGQGPDDPVSVDCPECLGIVPPASSSADTQERKA